jgi:hypothetical protein
MLWNMKVSENLVPLSGRILPCERIVLGRMKCDAGLMNDWTKKLRCELTCNVLFMGEIFFVLSVLLTY